LSTTGGLHVYVCGEAKAMAKDVNKTLAEIISEEKGISEQQAEELLNNLSKNGRYQQDVW
jgi:sulfite reductase alpha subunit-like flavoprotein